MLQSVSGGAAAFCGLATSVPRVLAGEFAPGFSVDHFVKEMGIALAEARRMKLALQGLALAESLSGGVAGPGAGPQRHPGAGAGAGGAVQLRLARALAAKSVKDAAWNVRE